MLYVFEKPSLFAKPITDIIPEIKNEQCQFAIKAGYIQYPGTISCKIQDLKSLQKAIYEAKSWTGIRIHDQSYCIIHNKLVATAIASIMLAIDGIEYTIKFLKNLIIIIVGHLKVYLHPTKKLVVIPTELTDILDDYIENNFNVVTY